MKLESIYDLPIRKPYGTLTGTEKVVSKTFLRKTKAGLKVFEFVFGVTRQPAFTVYVPAKNKRTFIFRCPKCKTLYSRNDRFCCFRTATETRK